MSAVIEGGIGGFAPYVAARRSIAVGEWVALEIVVGQDAEWRDDVLAEVFILIVAPDDHEIGVEGVQLFTDAPKTGHQAGAMFERRRVPFILTVFDTHGFGPVAGVFHLGGQVLVGAQGALQRNQFVFIGCDQRRVVSEAKAQDFCHFFTFFSNVPAGWVCSRRIVCQYFAWLQVGCQPEPD